MNPSEDIPSQHVPITAEIPLVDESTGPLPVIPGDQPTEPLPSTPDDQPADVRPAPRGHHLGWARVDTPKAVTSRGTHLGWARLDQPPAPEPAPPPPALEETAPVRVIQQTVSAARALVPEEPAGPGTIGRLAALVLTLGIAWALGVALLVWLGTLVFSS